MFEGLEESMEVVTHSRIRSESGRHGSQKFVGVRAFRIVA